MCNPQCRIQVRHKSVKGFMRVILQMFGFRFHSEESLSPLPNWFLPGVRTCVNRPATPFQFQFLFPFPFSFSLPLPCTFPCLPSPAQLIDMLSAQQTAVGVEYVSVCPSVCVCVCEVAQRVHNSLIRPSRYE